MAVERIGGAFGKGFGDHAANNALALHDGLVNGDELRMLALLAPFTLASGTIRDEFAGHWLTIRESRSRIAARKSYRQWPQR